MSKRSKSLIFISEKSDINYDVSSNLVRLYMNRSIIDEDDQFEILGVIQIDDQKSWTQYGHTFGYDMRSYLKTKIDKHLNVTSQVMKRSFSLVERFRAQNLATVMLVTL